MKTSVMEVRDMLSVLSVSGVEEQIGKVPGVESATVTYAAGTATVRYDETRLDIADIRSDVRQSGYETDSVPGASPGKGHEGPGGHSAAGAQPANAAPKDKAAPDAAPASPSKPAQPPSADARTPAAPKAAPADAATASASAAPPSGGRPDKVAPDKS